MKKNKPQIEEKQDAREELKPWMLQNISPQVRKIAKDCAREQGIKIGEWVTHAIIKSYQNEQDETDHVQSFSEIMEEYPNKAFMKAWFIDLRDKIVDLSEKIEKTEKPWWRFWA